MKRGLVTRLARPADDRALAELDAVAWPIELQVTPPQPATEPFFSQRRKPSDVVVAVADNQVLGYGRLARHLPTPNNSHVLHLDALAVHPSSTGGGVGSALISALVAEAGRRGARKLGLRALSTNQRAIALYKRAGFVEEGRLRDEIRLPDDSYADDVWLALWLGER